MPLHSFVCQANHLTEAYQPLSQLREYEPCGKCGEPAQKRFLRFPFAVVQADVHYESPVDGRVINSKHARIEDMARNNCIEYDPAMKDDQQRRIRESDEAIGQKIEHHFDSEVSAMPARKRELLEQELRSGADLEFTRSTL